MSVLVLGAGPAGLAFAARYGEQACVLERADDVGGLCRSVELGESVFDIGGHSFHTPHAEVAELVRELMGDNWHEQPRDARVWTHGQLIAYPFQRHFTQIDHQDVVRECAGHVADANAVLASQHFEEWILQKFGEGVARHFMLPYNRKLWARDLSEMDCAWVSERVATEPLKTGLPTRQPLQSESRVAYPLQGGFGAIFKALAARCAQIETGAEVVSIDMKNQRVSTRDGRAFSWKKIVSTLPVPVLLGMLNDCPKELIEAAARLQSVSLKVLLISAKLREGEIPQRIYCADADVPPHKIAFNHTSSPLLRKRAQHAISCEVSYSPHKALPSDEIVLERTINWLHEQGFIVSRADVAAAQVIDVPYGYPVYCHARRAILAQIMPWLNARGIHSIGRFGAWDYANSDECMRQGLELAATLEP